MRADRVVQASFNREQGGWMVGSYDRTRGGVALAYSLYAKQDDAERAVVTANLEALGFTLQETSGGCTAYVRETDGQSTYITIPEDPLAPHSMACAVVVGSGEVNDTMEFGTLWEAWHYLQRQTQ